MADRAAPLDVAQLVADHHQALYRYAYRLSGCEPDAEDLTQQVFLVAQQKAEQVRDSRCARAWLFAVLRNCYLRSFRGHRPTVVGDLDVDTLPDARADARIDSGELQAAINALADEFKLVVLLFYFEHRSYREIAETLCIPMGTVMSRLARAKAHLRSSLNGAETVDERTDSEHAGGARPAAWHAAVRVRP
jgi:RNA polymerase sigma-70 factor (ECF subfamily)